MSIGENIKRIREQQNIKQYKLAEMLHVTQPALTQWEQGKRIPQSDRLVEIANILKCSVEDLVEVNDVLTDHYLIVDYTEEYKASISQLERIVKDDPDPVWMETITIARNLLLRNNGKMVQNIPLTERQLREVYSWVKEHLGQKVVPFWRSLYPVQYELEMNLQFEITEAIQHVYKDDPKTMWHLLIARSKYSEVKLAI